MAAMFGAGKVCLMSIASFLVPDWDGFLNLNCCELTCDFYAFRKLLAMLCLKSFVLLFIEAGEIPSSISFVRS